MTARIQQMAKTPQEAQLEINKHLSKCIQTWAGEMDEEAGDEFARLVVGALGLIVTKVNEDDTSFVASVRLTELPVE